MSDRSIGVGEGNIPPGVCWGEGLTSVALEVGGCANRSRPGGGTPVRKNLIGEGVGGVRSFERLRLISALGGGVVGPFVDGGSIVGVVVTVGSAGSMTGDGGSGACTGAGEGVDCPLSGCGSRVSPCELGAGSGLSCVAGGSIVRSGRGGSAGPVDLGRAGGARTRHPRVSL